MCIEKGAWETRTDYHGWRPVDPSCRLIVGLGKREREAAQANPMYPCHSRGMAYRWNPEAVYEPDPETIAVSW